MAHVVDLGGGPIVLATHPVDDIEQSHRVLVQFTRGTFLVSVFDWRIDLTFHVLSQDEHVTLTVVWLITDTSGLGLLLAFALIEQVGGAWTSQRLSTGFLLSSMALRLVLLSKCLLFPLSGHCSPLVPQGEVPAIQPPDLFYVDLGLQPGARAPLPPTIIETLLPLAQAVIYLPDELTEPCLIQVDHFLLVLGSGGVVLCDCVAD